MEEKIELRNISKSINKKEILKDINLEIRNGEIFGIFGSSGCGKTTLLRIISGLDIADNGEIFLRGKKILSKKFFVPPEERKISFIFQDLGLWPHMTVNDHMNFVSENNSKTEKILESCYLTGHEKSKPEQLSGGEKQKLALARSIAQDADIILLDEPFSSLDLNTKEEMNKLLKELHKKYNLTIIYVTHDVFEIIDMCKRIAIIENGEISKIGDPSELLKYQLTKIKSKFKK
jgi:iron(III) transport system ATP-binding protein